MHTKCCSAKCARYALCYGNFFLMNGVSDAIKFTGNITKDVRSFPRCHLAPEQYSHKLYFGVRTQHRFENVAYTGDMGDIIDHTVTLLNQKYRDFVPGKVFT